MTARCALAALLEEGGPVRVSLRMCCVAALVGGEPPAEAREACTAEEPDASVLEGAAT